MVLTNSSTPFARQLALEFARNGARLALIDASKRAAEETVAWLSTKHSRVEATVYQCNLADKDAIETWVLQ